MEEVPMAIKMLVSDLDKTLLRDDKSLSGYTLSTLARMREKGILFTIATARPEVSVERNLPQLAYDCGVYHNGGLVDCFDGDRLHRSMPAGKAVAICRAIVAEDPKARVVVETGRTRYAAFDTSAVWPNMEFQPWDLEDLSEDRAEKVLVLTEDGDLSPYQKYLDESLYTQLSDGRLCMIMHKEARKLAGVESVCRKKGIPLSEVAAFGDDLTDMEMIAASGVGVAMGNALDVVKAAADQVCLSNEEDGVARWIEENLL